MPYQDVFVLFWKHVEESLQEGRFAKLTMAKTIGKPNLRNIFLRPVNSEDGFKVLLKLRYRSKETEDQEDKMTLEEAFVVLKSHLIKSFHLFCYLPQQRMLLSKLIKRVSAVLASLRLHLLTLRQLRRI